MSTTALQRTRITDTHWTLVLLTLLATCSYAIVYNNVHTFDPENPRGYGDTINYMRMASGEPVTTMAANRVLVPWMVRHVPAFPGWMFIASREVDERWQVVVRFGAVNAAGLVCAGLALASLLAGFGFARSEVLSGVVLFLCSGPIIAGGGLPLIDTWFFCFLVLCFVGIQQGNVLVLLVAFLLGVFTKELTFLIVPVVAISPVPRRRLLLCAILPGVLFYGTYVLMYHRATDASSLGYWISRVVTQPGSLLARLGTVSGILDLAGSFGVLWLLALRGLLRQRIPLLLKRWTWFIALTLAGMVVFGGNLGRSIYQTFPVVIPLALFGLRPWIEDEVRQEGALEEGRR